MRTISVTKMLSPREIRRQNIVHKYIENPRVTQRSIAKELKTTQATVSCVLNKFLNTNSIKKKKKMGEKRGFNTKICSRRGCSPSKIIQGFR